MYGRLSAVYPYQYKHWRRYRLKVVENKDNTIFVSKNVAKPYTIPLRYIYRYPMFCINKVIKNQSLRVRAWQRKLKYHAEHLHCITGVNDKSWTKRGHSVLVLIFVRIALSILLMAFQAHLKHVVSLQHVLHKFALHVDIDLHNPPTKMRMWGQRVPGRSKRSVTLF